jgi:CheY-like chemotaxis protein
MITMTPSILIVDDHPSFRAMARALLQSEGYTIVGEAVDGASALTAVRELQPRGGAAGRAAGRTRTDSPSPAS